MTDQHDNRAHAQEVGGTAPHRARGGRRARSADGAGARLSSSPVVTFDTRVRYAETDRMGVAYYANYLVWFEVGRTEWLRALGFSYRAIEDAGVILPVIEARCEYRQSLKYDDDLQIRTRGTLLSPIRLQFHYDIVRSADGAVAASGHTMHASVDRTGRPCRLPEPLRRLFA
jgi:acyl-CoA thioester hydrolase